MSCAELNQRLRHLLRRAYSYIGYITPMKRPRLIEIDDTFDEVRAIPREEVKMRVVRRRVQLENQSLILFTAGLNLETISCPVIG